MLAIGAGLVGAVGDCLLNQWAKYGGRVWWAIGGFVCWNLALGLFTWMLGKGLLAHCVLLFLTSNCLLVLMVSRLVFREAMTAQQWVGVFLALVALVLMERG